MQVAPWDDDEVIISYLKEKQVSKNLGKNRNAWKSFKRNRPIHASMENRRQDKYDDDDDDDDDYDLLYDMS